MKTLEEIREKINKVKPLLKEKYHASNFLIFGSYSRNEQKENSDLDLLVEFDAPVDMFTFLDLEEELKQILEIKIDLGTPESLKSFVKDKILKEAVII